MALYEWTADNITPVAVNDTTNFTDAGYLALLGGNSTQIVEYLEMQIMGLAAAAAVLRLILALDSTLGASSLSGGGTLSKRNPSAVAPGTLPTKFNASTTKPQRSTAYMKVAAFNAFGGGFAWAQQVGFGIFQVGNATNGGEMSLSSVSGTSAFSSNFLIDLK